MQGKTPEKETTKKTSKNEKKKSKPLGVVSAYSSEKGKTSHLEQVARDERKSSKLT